MTRQIVSYQHLLHSFGTVILAFAMLMALQVHSVVAQEVTFSKDLAPILYESCVECHRPNSFAPMSLLTYEDARRYAPRIRS